eukprot:jgi/Tetstr1/439550/TSEL_027979.t1
MQDLDISRKARIQTPDSVILVEKDDTQHEGAVTRIKEWLALSKDEADAPEERKHGTFPRKASGDAEDGEEAEEPLAQELCSLAHVGKSIAGGQDDGHATEENEQAKANEDVANPVREDDDDEEEEEEEEGEEEGTGEDNTGSEEDEYDDEDEEETEEEEEEEEEESGHSSSEAADSECDDDVDDDASSDADDDALGD